MEHSEIDEINLFWAGRGLFDVVGYRLAAHLPRTNSIPELKLILSFHVACFLTH